MTKEHLNDVTVTLPKETLDNIVEHYLTAWESLEREDKLRIKTFLVDHKTIFDLDYLLTAYPAVDVDWTELV